MNSPPVFIIAEVGVNHNGSLDLAKELVRVAAMAGADAVKFQTFKAEQLADRKAPKVAYQVDAAYVNESQMDMLKRLELTRDMHFELLEYCMAQGIQFLSTPFDFDSADFLINELKLPRIKISSGELTTAPLLFSIAQAGKPIILSTGMSTLGEIETALGVLALGYLKGPEQPSLNNFRKAYASLEGRKLLQENVVLLHCTSEYPAPFSSIHLQAMDTIKNAFGLEVGYSDHSCGIAVPIAAVARGAKIIEKHFTMDRKLPGPDHQASLEPFELVQMISSIRQVEQAIGQPSKHPSLTEVETSMAVRKSLISLSPIKKGDLFSARNVGMKRPGYGIAPIEYWNWIGRVAMRDYDDGDLICE